MTILIPYAQLVSDYLDKKTLITRCDGRRCIDDWVHTLPLTRSYSRNYELSLMGVGPGLYMYDVVVKRSRSLSHLLMSYCNQLQQHRLRPPATCTTRHS